MKHLAERLVKRYGSGWGFKKLQHCLRAAYTFSEAESLESERKAHNKGIFDSKFRLHTITHDIANNEAQSGE